MLNYHFLSKVNVAVSSKVRGDKGHNISFFNFYCLLHVISSEELDVNE